MTIAETTGERTGLSLSATDGFRYIGFEPPVDAEVLNGCPLPTMSLKHTGDFSWDPTSIRATAGKVLEIGFFSEAFHGSDDTFESYAQKVATHIGGRVLKSATRYVK